MLKKPETRGETFLRVALLGGAAGLVVGLLLGAVRAKAHDRPRSSYTCQDVYVAVDAMGEAVARAFAIANLTRAERRAAQQCLRDRAQIKTPDAR